MCFHGTFMDDILDSYLARIQEVGMVERRVVVGQVRIDTSPNEFHAEKDFLHKRDVSCIFERANMISQILQLRRK
jgi:hypothetical protein